MPMSEIEILLKHNSEFVKMRDKMMEEQRDKIEKDRNKRKNSVSNPIYYL